MDLIKAESSLTSQAESYPNLLTGSLSVSLCKLPSQPRIRWYSLSFNSFGRTRVLANGDCKAEVSGLNSSAESSCTPSHPYLILQDLGINIKGNALA